MKKTLVLMILLAFLYCPMIIAQQYTAIEYWKMEHDTAYVNAKTKQEAGTPLSVTEQDFLSGYKTKLQNYFESMPDSEKASYYQNRAKWSQQPVKAEVIASRQNNEIYSGERSVYTKYLVSSGLFGYTYGLAGVYVFGMESEGAVVGIPLLTSGASILIPMLSTGNRNVTYNSLILSTHGKAIGLLQGTALGLVFTGDNVEDGKLLFGLATLTSIGLGRLGYNLGKDMPWSAGRVGLYSHYGFLMPLEGLALTAALKVEDPRTYGAASILFGAGGYLIADKVARSYDYTKGDITSLQTLSVMHGLLGLGIIMDIRSDGDLMSSDLLWPAAGALAGTFLGQALMKNVRLTNQQGRNTALAASGGATIGLGIASIIGAESATPYYLIPYITGITSYAIMVGKYKKDNALASYVPEKISRWNISLMPQNILLNNELVNKRKNNAFSHSLMLPAFSASIAF